MKLTVKLLDIANRGVLLHSNDAQFIRVRDGDRVQIADEETGRSVQAHVDTTGSLVEPGVIGVYRPLNDALGADEGTPVEVRSAERPPSLSHIKKKMDGGRFTKEETLDIVKDIISENLSPGEITAYVIASYINGLDMDEVEHLTRALTVEPASASQFTPAPGRRQTLHRVPGSITLLVVRSSPRSEPTESNQPVLLHHRRHGRTSWRFSHLLPASEVQKMTEGRVASSSGAATNIAPADDKIITYNAFPDRRPGADACSVMAKVYRRADIVVIDIPVGGIPR